MAQSSEDAEFRSRVGDFYEYGGGSGTSRGRGGPTNVLNKMFRRSSSMRETPSVRDYNVAVAKGPVQQRIDTGIWTKKRKNAKTAIGLASSNFFTLQVFLVEGWMTYSLLL